MSGANESLLEKLLKPIRINPVFFSLSLSSLGLSYVLSDSDNTMDRVLSHISFFDAGLFLGMYLYSTKNYFRDRKIINKSGFDKRHGDLRVGRYCDRQAFYVASIENGFRDEAKNLINNTSNREKQFHYFPHI